MNTRLRYVAVLSAILGLLLMFNAKLGSAQGITTGSISGTVYDPQKAVVPGRKSRLSSQKLAAVLQRKPPEKVIS